MANQTEFGGSVDNDSQAFDGVRPEYDGDQYSGMNSGDPAFGGNRYEYGGSDGGVVSGTNKEF